MSDQTGTTYRCPECSGLDHVHKPNCPQHNDGERWTVWACACGVLSDDLAPESDRPVTCLTCNQTERRIEVVPATRADALAEAVERFVDDAGAWGDCDFKPLGEALIRYREGKR